MAFLRRFFLEDLALLLMAGAVGVAIALALHRRRYTARSRRRVWMTLGVCVVLIAMQYAVVTPREALEAMVARLARAVDEGDVAAIGACIDEDGVRFGRGLEAERVTKEEFLAAVNVGLQAYQVDEAGTGGFTMTIDGDEATLTFRAVADLRQQERVEYHTPTQWEVHCVRRAEGWKLDGIVSAKVALGSVVQGLDIMPELRGWVGRAKEELRGR